MMKKYPKYKDSGIEWMGIIPENWDVRRLKYLTDSIKEKSIDGSEELLSVSEHNGIIPRKEIRDENETLTRSDSLEGYLKVKKGDLVNNIMLMWKRGLGVSRYDGIVSPAYSVFRFRTGSPTFYDYLLRTDLYTSEFRKNSTGVIDSRLRLYDDEFGKIHCFLPPLSEQLQLVDFLNQKTSIIDDLIQKKQWKIELLKEHRTSFINQTVTKGLNSNVKFKDTGVEWIGKIPEHWSYVRIGYYTHVVRGGSPRPAGDPLFFDGDFIHWITVKEITSKEGKYITTTDSKLTEEGMKCSRVLEPETLVLTNSGATLGVPGILKIRGCINDGSVGFLNISEKVLRDFLYYFWTTQTDLLRIQQSGYGQPNLNIDIVSNVRFPLPPVQEQNQIVEYLDKKTNEIDNTITLENKKIELLKEYRQSLISEVVTGKIDVRKN